MHTTSPANGWDVYGGIASRTGICIITMRRVAPTLLCFALLDWLPVLRTSALTHSLITLAGILFMFGHCPLVWFTNIGSDMSSSAAQVAQSKRPMADFVLTSVLNRADTVFAGRHALTCCPRAQIFQTGEANAFDLNPVAIATTFPHCKLCCM